MYLTDSEKEILDGKKGPDKQAAMDLLVRYGEALNADRLLDVRNVAFSTYSPYPPGRVGHMDPENYDAIFAFRNLGVKGDFKISRIDTDAGSLATNAPIDYLKHIGATDEMIRATEIVDAFRNRVGISSILTCTPYIVGQVPAFGEHCAWGESSAVIFINSVLGARTNCEGKEAGGAAALVGKIPHAGLHLDENRLATHLVHIEYQPKTFEEWDLLGYAVGKHVGAGVPLIVGNFEHLTNDIHKSFGCAMTSGGAIDLYHVLGHTPEAHSKEKILGEKKPIELKIGKEEILAAREKLDFSQRKDIECVILGCPHYSIEQVRKAAYLLEGRKCKIPVYIMAARQVKYLAICDGLNQIIEDAGGFILTDCCPALAQVWPFDFSSMATDSGKQAHYIPGSKPNMQIHLGSMERCIDSAITGIWR